MRTALLAATTIAALALAGGALAANTATVAVSHSPMATSSSQSTTIHIAIPQSTDPIARIAIYAPSGYSASLGAAAGTKIGEVSASAFARDTGLTLPLTGDVVADNPANHTSDACAPGTHAAVWILNLSVAGQTTQLPVYVDPTSGSEAALGAYKIVTCLPPPDVPQGTPGRAIFGVQVLDTKFTVNGIFTTPSSSALLKWESLFTPYNPGKGTPNLAGTFETQSLVGIPDAVSLKATSVKHKTFRVTGKATEGGVGAGSVSIQFFKGGSATSLARVTSTKTSSTGAYSFSGKLGKKPVFFQTQASADERATSCQSPLPATVAPAGCASATLSPWSANSVVVKLKP